jgi:hypothetical protein
MLPHENLKLKRKLVRAIRLRVYPMPSMPAKYPKEVVKDAHNRWYSTGEYSGNRFRWAIETFLPLCRGKRIPKVTRGSGNMLKLLQPK